MIDGSTFDWNLFWTAFGAIGGTVGALATTAAVIVALWQTKYSQKKKIKLSFPDNYMLYNSNTGASIKFIGVGVSNIGNRKVIIQNWGVYLKKDTAALIVTPTDVSSFEKMVYPALPKTLDLEETIALQWQQDRFKSFLQTNKDNIDKDKPLTFFVQDSTGKRYEVKTQKNASAYIK